MNNKNELLWAKTSSWRISAPNKTTITGADRKLMTKNYDTNKKALLTFKEFCEYLGVGQTKGREIISRNDCNYRIKIGNRIYAHKEMLDKYLLDCMKYGIPI